MRYNVHCERLHSEHVKALKQSTSENELVDRVVESTVIHTGTLTVLLLPTGSTFLKNKKIHVSTANLLIVAPTAGVELSAKVIKSMALYDSTSEKDPNDTLDTKPMHKVVSEPSYSVTITLMLPQPHLTLAVWDSEAAVKQYLSPLLSQLDNIQMNVTVRSQKMYMTPLSGIKPQWQEDKQHFAVPHTHLPLAINAIESKLGN